MKRGFMDCYTKRAERPGDAGQWRRAFRQRLGLDAARAAVGSESPRAILGVGESAGWEEIRAAHRALVKLHHPDRAGGDAARFRRVQGAFEVLEEMFHV